MFFLRTKTGSFLAQASPLWKYKIFGGKWSRDWFFGTVGVGVGGSMIRAYDSIQEVGWLGTEVNHYYFLSYLRKLKKIYFGKTSLKVVLKWNVYLGSRKPKSKPGWAKHILTCLITFDSNFNFFTIPKYKKSNEEKKWIFIINLALIFSN